MTRLLRVAPLPITLLMNSPTHTTPSVPKTNSRWMFLMNIVVAVVLISAVLLLKNSASHYQSGSAFNSDYIALTKTETDPAMLQYGILHTEAARAHAYRSILKQSNGTFIVGLIIALAFLANSIFIYRLTRAQKLPMVDTVAA